MSRKQRRTARQSGRSSDAPAPAPVAAAAAADRPRGSSCQLEQPPAPANNTNPLAVRNPPSTPSHSQSGTSCHLPSATPLSVSAIRKSETSQPSRLSFNSRCTNIEELNNRIRARLGERKATTPSHDSPLHPLSLHHTPQSDSASIKSQDTSETTELPAERGDEPQSPVVINIEPPPSEPATLDIPDNNVSSMAEEKHEQKSHAEPVEDKKAPLSSESQESEDHADEDEHFASADEEEPVTPVVHGDSDEDVEDTVVGQAEEEEAVSHHVDLDKAKTDDLSKQRPESSASFPKIDVPLSSLPPKPDELSEEIAPDDMQERPPSPPKRKFTSPFSFFSRSNTNVSSSKSPDRTRRSTASSAATETDDGSGLKKPNRASLRDRFKLLRMQEEAGVVLDDDLEARPVSPSRESAIEVSSQVDETESISRKRQSSGAKSQPSTAPPVNENLPPGTAAGTVTGPSAESGEPVDWDLWQAVVYEGPAAVARSSAADLNAAITKGIPSAIRGVVWQVLAQSKNEELESVYRDLVARGSEDPRFRRSSNSSKRPNSLSRPQSVAGSVAASIRETISEASEESEDTPSKTPNGDVNGTSPTSEANTVDFVKAQAKLAAEEKRKAKDEAAALGKLERAIKRDLGARTSYSKFLMSQGLQNGLFGVCKAYALFDEEVGYAQGMNFIAMPLLFNMPEEEAFTLFVRLMNHYKLRDLFVADMPGLHLHLYQFSRLLEDFEPALYCHLNRRQVHPQLYATQWFLTLFAYRFPLQLVLRIYDLILSEGLESAILKFGIVLMQKNSQKLLEMRDMTVLTQFLKERLFDVYIDKSPSASSVLESGFFGSTGGIDKEVYRADQLVQDACSVPITKEMLVQYTKEWQEKTREEKAAQLEKDALKSTNARLLLENKTLRERTDDLDKEHVTIASDLVHTKVQNQQLIDDNEALRTQVRDLQKIITSQPGEVEDRLRQEMERIMQRNAEVQGQNRLLEEEREQVESELVKAKMEKAEMGEELEKWKQKWQTVAGLMKDIPSP